MAEPVNLFTGTLFCFFLSVRVKKGTDFKSLLCLILRRFITTTQSFVTVIRSLFFCLTRDTTLGDIEQTGAALRMDPEIRERVMLTSGLNSQIKRNLA